MSANGCGIEVVVAVADVVRSDGLLFPAEELRRMHDGVRFFWQEDQKRLLFRGSFAELKGGAHLSIAEFDALPDVTPSVGRRRLEVDGRTVDVPTMIEPAGALFTGPGDGLFLDPRDRSTWMVGILEGRRVRRRAGG